MESKIKEGSIVQLRSGGPKMCVNQIADNAVTVSCIFYDPVQHEMRTVQVHINTLLLLNA